MFLRGLADTAMWIDPTTGKSVATVPNPIAVGHPPTLRMEQQAFGPNAWILTPVFKGSDGQDWYGAKTIPGTNEPQYQNANDGSFARLSTLHWGEMSDRVGPVAITTTQITPSLLQGGANNISSKTDYYYLFPARNPYKYYGMQAKGGTGGGWFKEYAGLIAVIAMPIAVAALAPAAAGAGAASSGGATAGAAGATTATTAVAAPSAAILGGGSTAITGGAIAADAAATAAGAAAASGAAAAATGSGLISLSTLTTAAGVVSGIAKLVTAQKNAEANATLAAANGRTTEAAQQAALAQQYANEQAALQAYGQHMGFFANMQPSTLALIGGGVALLIGLFALAMTRKK